MKNPAAISTIEARSSAAKDPRHDSPKAGMFMKQSKLVLTFSLILAVSLAGAGVIPTGQVTQIHTSQDDTSFDYGLEFGQTLDERIVALWGDNRNLNSISVDRDLFVALSGDAGLSWTGDFQVSNTSWQSSQLALTDGWTSIIATGPDELVATYYSSFNNVPNLTPDEPRVFFRKSTDGGQSWTLLPNFYISPEDCFHQLVHDPASGTSYFFASFYPESGGPIEIPHDILMFTSNDGFDTFSDPVLISNGEGTAGGVAVSDTTFDAPNINAAVNNGHVWVVWEDLRSGTIQPYASYSPDGGGTWFRGALVPGAEEWERHSPQVLVEPDGTAHFTYEQQRDDHIWYVRATPTQEDPNFTTPMIIRPDRAAGDLLEVRDWDGALTENGNPYYAISYDRPTLNHLYTVFSYDGGDNFLGDILVDDSRIASVELELTGSGANQVLTIGWDALADDDAGNFQDGAYYSTVVAIDEQLPTAPQNPTVTPLAGALRVEWSASTDNVGIQRYEIERAPAAGGDFQLVATTLPDQLSYSEGELTTSYRYRVRAVDQTRNPGPYSTVASGTPQPLGANPVSGDIWFERADSVWRVVADGSGEQQIAASGDRPVLFANGQRLAYRRPVGAEDNEPVSAALDGSDVQPIALPGDEELWVDYDIAGNPYPLVREDQRFIFCPAALTGFPFQWSDGGGQTAGTFSGVAGIRASASPDGTLFGGIAAGTIFCGGFEDYGDGAMYLHNRVLDEGEAFGAGFGGIQGEVLAMDFSPDGNQVTYVERLNDTYDVKIADVSADPLSVVNARPLTSSPQGIVADDPTFSLNGEWIVFVRGGGLHVVNADGSSYHDLGITGVHPAAMVMEANQGPNNPPGAATLAGILAADASATDPDGEAVDYRYRWTSDGSDQPVEQGPTANTRAILREGEGGATFGSGETWTLTVTPIDARGAEGPESSAQFVIGPGRRVSFRGW